MLRSKLGQSTVEYLILVAGVIAILIVFVGNNSSIGFRAALNRTYNSATQGMEGMANRLSSSRCNATGGNCI